MSAIDDFKDDVAALLITGERKNITAEKLRTLLNDLADIVDGLGGGTGPTMKSLPNVIALTGEDETALDNAIPDTAQHGDLFAISPPGGIAAIGLDVEQMAVYKLRLKVGEEAVNGTSKVQPVNAGFENYLLFRVQ